MATRMPLSWRQATGRLSYATARPNTASLPRAAFRRAYSSQPPKGQQKVKFWPFALIIGAGFLGYAGLVNRRVGKEAPFPPLLSFDLY